MSTTIVPLAGPDFYSTQFGIRPLFPIAGVPLIEHVLLKRPWISQACKDDRLIFVLRDEQPHTDIMRAFIKKKFPLAKVIILDHLTAGAPFSSLAGIALSNNHQEPVIVDLADIAFETSLNPEKYFAEHLVVDAIVPYFLSQDPKFSYLELDGKRIIRAREKKIISSYASAGVYCFRNTSTYMRAIKHILDHPEDCTINDVYFVCPSINGLIGCERETHAIEVQRAEPLSTLFHF